ncbi:MAG: hypothetical protein Q9213_006320 [Squamulea squamosa]
MTDYEKLTVVKLREELVKRGLPKTGVKAILVQRLVEADEQSAPTETPTNNSEATGPEGNDETAVNASPPTTSGEQQNGASAVVDTKQDEVGSKSTPVGIPQVDGPDFVEPDTNQESLPELGDTSADLRDTADENSLKVAKTEVVDQSRTKAQPVEAASTAPLDNNVTPAEKQVAAPVTQIPAETTESAAPFVEEETPALSRSESATGEELIRDMRKRKRRSLTPTPSDESVQKKAKTTDAGPTVKLPEDQSMDDVNAPPVSDAPAEEPTEAPEPNDTEDTVMENAPPIINVNSSGEAVRPVDASETNPSTNDPGTDVGTPPEAPETIRTKQAPEIEASQPTNGLSNASPESPAKNSSPDARFKNLLHSTSRHEGSPARQAPEQTNDRVVSPALHPATTALYIRDILRPLHIENLKDHLVALATPSSSSPDPSIIADFFLDSIRTHCLVRFTTVAAASRVRTGLHDRVWPDEKNRKPLWVDFVPEEKLPQWFEVENASSGRGQTAKRYEVIYENEDDGVKAYLQLVGSNNNGGLRSSQPAIGVRKESGAGVQGAPLGPRIRAGGDQGISQKKQPHPDQGQGFQALDDLFRSTTAKPKLYFLPVPQRTAEKRLDLLADGRGGGRRDGIHRYTFENGELVDRGPETQRGGNGFDRGRGGPYRGYSDRGGAYRGGYRGDYRNEYRGGGGDYRSDYRRDRR